MVQQAGRPLASRAADPRAVPRTLFGSLRSARSDPWKPIQEQVSLRTTKTKAGAPTEQRTCVWEGQAAEIWPLASIPMQGQGPQLTAHLGPSGGASDRSGGSATGVPSVAPCGGLLPGWGALFVGVLVFTWLRAYCGCWDSNPLATAPQKWFRGCCPLTLPHACHPADS